MNSTTTSSRRIPALVLILAALAALTALTMSGCASKGDFEALQRQVRANRVETDHRLTDMDQRLGEKVEPVQARQAESWAEVEQMKTRLGQLQNQVDGVSAAQQSTKAVNLPEMSRQIEAMRLALSSQLGIDIAAPETPEGGAAKAAIATDQKTAAFTPAAPAQTAPMAPAASAAQAAQTSAKADSGDAAQTLYDRALEAFKNKKYDESQSFFEEFYTSFPKHPNVSSAMFWRGEAFYQMGRFSEAALEYENVKSKFPKSNKYQSAMLKQGMSLYKMNQKDAGKFVLDDLIKRFPDSPEAKRAKSFIQNPS